MHRYLAVHIQHPQISYAALFRLDRPHRRTRQLVTLRENQSEAVVEVHLLEERRGEKAKPERLLHTFWLRNLPARSAGRTQISVEGSYDGRGRADVSVLVAGEIRDQVTLRVPREPKWPKRVGVGVGVLLLLLALFGGWSLLRPGDPAGPRGESSQSLPAEADESERERSETEEVVAVDPPGENEGVEGAASTVNQRDQESNEPVRSEPPDTRTGGDEPSTPATNGSGAVGDAAAPAPAAVEEPPPRREFVVYFAPDRTALSQDARSRLNEVVQVLTESRSGPVRIVGHTALFGTEEGRVEISRGRAQNVYDYLTSQGWEPSATPTVAWEASTDPVTLDRDRQELNRRVEIEVGGEELNQ